MPVNKTAYLDLVHRLESTHTSLVAVSKTKPVEDIMALYEMGQRDFGENYVQELVDKQSRLPEDIRWHFIGHLQSNKVKYIAPFVYLVHGVDSLKLLQVIHKQGVANGRVIRVLLQVHIADEETKFGMDRDELYALLQDPMYAQGLDHAQVCGLMGMASFTEDQEKVRNEFRKLKGLFEEVRERFFTGSENFNVLSMGMSGDYLMAIEEGSNMVRIGSLLFGSRS